MKKVSLRIALIITWSLLPHVTHTMEITPAKDKSQKMSIIRTTGISDGEREFLKKRLPVVKAALEKMLNRPLDEKQIPKIAMVCSGGGYRAMLCTTGSLCGAQKINLLDATTYITALSGSTWAVAPWISTQKPIHEFRKYLQKCAAKQFADFTAKEELLVGEVMLKKSHVHPVTDVNPYGYCLANRLLKSLGKNRQTATLSDQATIIKNGAYPYAIYTAIDGRETIISGQTWYEFTVDTVGDRTNNILIPTKAYGIQFENGEITQHGHEKSLGYNMGTWGSAFGANVHEIIKNVVKNPALRKEIEDEIPHTIEAHRPLHFYAEIPNYMYKLDNLADVTLSQEQYLKFVDAGLEINLPYPPISGICSERTPEIIIFLDASAGTIPNELKKAEAYAHKHALKFPEIDYTHLHKQTISVFKNEQDKETPIVIYMPRISDKELWEKCAQHQEFASYNLSGFDLNHETNHGFAKTQEFQYTPEHSAYVMNQTEFNMCVNKDIIMQTINWVIDRK